MVLGTSNFRGTAELEVARRQELPFLDELVQLNGLMRKSIVPTDPGYRDILYCMHE